MIELGESVCSRRTILGLAIGLLAAGCAKDRGMPRITRPAQGFPYPSPWCFKPNTAKPLDMLGRLIMRDRNPSCSLPPPNAPNTCDPTNTDTWPHELTDETTWKLMTEFDFQPSPSFEFIPATTVTLARSMRIPYLIKHTIAKKKKVPIKVGRENLLVGFGPRTGPVTNPQPWGDPDVACHEHSVGELAQFITDNMMPAMHTESLFVANWNVEQLGSLEAGSPNARWFFRRTPIHIDYSFRFPVATRQGTVGTPSAGWIYIGYEGGGAY